MTSNWTHVAATARLDCLIRLSQPVDATAIFGKECLFDDDVEIWRDATENSDSYLPMGSEGSLQMSVWNNPDKSHIASTTVSIFGDLRDHDDPDEIVEWFKAKLKDQWVRQAVITVENEMNGTVSWTYVSEEN